MKHGLGLLLVLVTLVGAQIDPEAQRFAEKAAEASMPGMALTGVPVGDMAMVF